MVVGPGFESHETEAYVSVTSYSYMRTGNQDELVTRGDIVLLDNPSRSGPFYPRCKIVPPQTQ